MVSWDSVKANVNMTNLQDILCGIVVPEVPVDGVAGLGEVCIGASVQLTPNLIRDIKREILDSSGHTQDQEGRERRQIATDAEEYMGSQAHDDANVVIRKEQPSKGSDKAGKAVDIGQLQTIAAIISSRTSTFRGGDTVRLSQEPGGKPTRAEPHRGSIRQ